VVALEVVGKLQPSKRLLVHGARGGVGHACARFGQHLGADVIASATDPEQIAALAASGIHTVSARPGFRNAVLQHTDGRGAGVVVDSVGGDVFDESMRSVAWGGRLLVLGFASGRIASLATNRALIKGPSILGVRVGEYRRRHPAQRAGVLARVGVLAKLGALRPLISRTYALGETVQALSALEGRGVPGRILVRTADIQHAAAVGRF
jgi:NADPH2:quinone reductase